MRTGDEDAHLSPRARMLWIDLSIKEAMEFENILFSWLSFLFDIISKSPSLQKIPQSSVDVRTGITDIVAEARSFASIRFCGIPVSFASDATYIAI